MNYPGPFYLSFIPKNRGKIDFYTSKYGKDRISFLSASAIKGKSYDKV